MTTEPTGNAKLCDDCEHRYVCAEEHACILQVGQCEHTSNGVRCCRHAGHTDYHHYRCASLTCPGRSWIASIMLHPSPCTGAARTGPAPRIVAVEFEIRGELHVTNRDGGQAIYHLDRWE
jgi:hypothetical protein